MATNAEHQKALRVRRMWGDLARLNTYIEADCKAHLDRLAAINGLTQKAMLEKLISDAIAAAEFANLTVD